ncbi:MAG TPA: YiiX/YebB-like N1pC/P60 family cysteine hydrolase [Rhodocyclaceae bacterium]|nr:YiiX/YebB-like N1pC/P60 family cysteine hydrolase [Rhodocyclaceae bacterium]
MRVLFCTSRLPGAALIRAVTWSAWSHVALVDGDQVIEAVWPAVRVAPLAEVIASHSDHVIADLPCHSPEDVIKAARSQVGKPYDLTALAGLLAHRDWQENDRWFCSELVAWAFSQGGSPLFRPEAMHRITPQHLWMLSPSNNQLSQPV